MAQVTEEELIAIENRAGDTSDVVELVAEVRRLQAVKADEFALALHAAFAQGQRAALIDFQDAVRAIRFATMDGKPPWASLERLERLVGVRR